MMQGFLQLSAQFAFFLGLTYPCADGIGRRRCVFDLSSIRVGQADLIDSFPFGVRKVRNESIQILKNMIEPRTYFQVNYTAFDRSNEVA
jgi:hypothetical protein